jgi:hypothetical protein
MKTNPYTCTALGKTVEPLCGSLKEYLFYVEVAWERCLMIYLSGKKVKKICQLNLSILLLSTIFLLDFGAVPTVWYSLFIILFN